MASKTGAKRQSWFGSNPREVMRRALKANPRASEKELSDSLWEEFQKGKHWRPIFEYWFANNFRSFKIEVAEGTVAVLNDYRRIRADGKKKMAAMREKLKFDLMDHMLSSGKLLRFATFGDCATEGGWLALVAKKGRANQVVGRVLTEANLRAIRQRNSKVA